MCYVSMRRVLNLVIRVVWYTEQWRGAMQVVVTGACGILSSGRKPCRWWWLGPVVYWAVEGSHAGGGDWGLWYTEQWRRAMQVMVTGACGILSNGRKPWRWWWLGPVVYWAMEGSHAGGGDWGLFCPCLLPILLLVSLCFPIPHVS
jgi:hypothetical protein